MQQGNTKINPYVIIIVILIVVVGALAYNQWGRKDIDQKATVKQEKTVDIIDIVVGNEKAPVTVIEYFSYFCSFCKLFHDETYPQIVDEYISTGKVKFVLRAFPPFELGLAFLCANEQDKALEYHNELFAKSQEIQDVDSLKDLAGSVGLNENEFNTCMDTGKYAAETEAWYIQADADFTEVGVPVDQRGTPAFFINGELLLGAQPYENFVNVIDSKL